MSVLLLKYTISILIFCLLKLSVSERYVKISYEDSGFVKFAFYFVSFCLVYYKGMLLDTYKIMIIIS